MPRLNPKEVVHHYNTSSLTISLMLSLLLRAKNNTSNRMINHFLSNQEEFVLFAKISIIIFRSLSLICWFGAFAETTALFLKRTITSFHSSWMCGSSPRSCEPLLSLKCFYRPNDISRYNLKKIQSTKTSIGLSLPADTSTFSIFILLHLCGLLLSSMLL